MSCNFENGFNYKKDNNSFNKNDIIGIRLFITLCVIFILFITSIILFYKKKKKLGIKVSIIYGILIIIFLIIIFIRPINTLYIPSSLITLSTRTPTFLNRKEYFPSHHKFENPCVVKKLKYELQNVLKKTKNGKQITKTGDTFGGENSYIGSDIKKIDNEENAWRLYSVKLGDNYTEKGQKDFPTLVNILKSTPEVKSCAVSILEPKVTIPIHVGYYKGVIRYMLPLVVPKDRENVFLCVNGEKYNWKEGVGVLWDDCYPHKVYNNTDEIRVVLYMDIERPKLPKLLEKINKFCIKLATESDIVKKESKKTEVQKKIN